jgi:hypothetical protein
MLVREIISEVRNDVRAVSNDAWIPGKYIHFKLKGIASLFIKREADDKRLFRYSELWTTIECMEFEEVDLVNCCDIAIPNCKKVMKSKKKLPEVYSTRYGYLLNVSSVDYDRDYLQTTPQQYKYTKSREFQDKSKRYFWIENGYIIVPDSMVEVLRVRGMFLNKSEALALNCDAADDDGCVGLLDQLFVAPEHLLQDIKAATTASILGTFRRVQPDEMTNNNESEKTNPTKI